MKRLIALLAVLLLLFAGCGDDGGSGDSGSSDNDEDEEQTEDTEDEEEAEELALDDWVDEVNDICTSVNDDVDELDEPASLDDFEVWIEAGGQASEIRSDGLAEIEELGLPDESSDEAEEFLELWAEHVELIDEVVAAAEAEDTDEIEAVANAGRDAQEARDEVAEDLGLDECLSEDEPTDDGPEDPEGGDGGDSGAGGPMSDVSDLSGIEAEIESGYTSQIGLAIDVTCDPVDLATVSSFECEGIDEELDVLTIAVTALPDGTFAWEVTAVNGVSG